MSQLNQLSAAKEQLKRVEEFILAQQNISNHLATSDSEFEDAVEYFLNKITSKIANIDEAMKQAITSNQQHVVDDANELCAVILKKIGK
jgi:hypothetical protein